MELSTNENEIFKKAIFIRQLENFFLELFSKGLLNGTIHTCVGQELTPVVLSKNLIKGDKVFSNHRGHGHYLAGDNSYEKLIWELLGKSKGVSFGVGGSQHIYTDSFISNGLQGGLVPIAVGYAYALKLKESKNISACYVGDGTMGEGQFYEALTLAGIFEAMSERENTIIEVHLNDQAQMNMG